MNETFFLCNEYYLKRIYLHVRTILIKCIHLHVRTISIKLFYYFSILFYYYFIYTHSVEKTVEKIEDACRFTSRLLEHGDAVEILALRRIVGTQLMNLIKNTPKPNVSFSIQFQTDYNEFEKALKVGCYIMYSHISANRNMLRKYMIVGNIW